MPQLKGEPIAELLVINDGSTDETCTVLDDLQLKHGRGFRVIHKENGGPASARNLGVLESYGKFLVFLDADDELAPDALVALAQHIADHPQTRMVIGEHWSVFPGGRRRHHTIGDLPETAEALVRGYLLDKTITLSNGACAMHREVFSVGGYPEHLRNTEDIPVFAQVLARYHCSVLNQPLVSVYKHHTSLRHNLSHARAARLQLVEEVFAPERMPAGLQFLKRPYTAQRCLSLFRTFHAAGEYLLARKFYCKAVREDWSVLFKWSYTRKAMRMLFRR